MAKTGESAASRANVVGELDHGHAGLAGARHRAAHRGPTQAQAVRSHQGAHLAHHDEEHHRTRRLSARCHIRHLVRRSLLVRHGERHTQERGPVQAHAALHHDIQLVCAHDPLQRDQLAQDTRRAQYFQGILQQSNLLQHLDGDLVPSGTTTGLFFFFFELFCLIVFFMFPFQVCHCTIWKLCI